MKISKVERDNNELNYSKFDINMTEFVNDNNIKSLTNYLIITSIKERFTYLYEKKNNIWEILYKYSCTVGKSSTPTIKGVFKVGQKYEAIGTENSSARYATNIIGEYYYHSILYDPKDLYIIDDSLGVAISHGCIRLATSSAKWIYDNIAESSTIVIH